MAIHAAAPAAPVISVITPVFRGAALMQACLDNVAAQGCPHVEHIVVDGGSLDGTVAVLEANTAAMPWLSWVSEPDKGQSDAMNKGIALARAPYISFLNVDDFYEPGALGRAVEIIKALQQPTFLVGNCNVWDDDGRLIHVNRPERLEVERLALGWRFHEHPINPAAYFYPRALHDMVGLYRLDEEYALDLEFILRAVRAMPARHFDEVWGNYRRVRGTKTVTLAEEGRSVAVSRRVYLRNFRALPWRTQLKVAARYAYYSVAYPARDAWRRRARRRAAGA